MTQQARRSIQPDPKQNHFLAGLQAGDYNLLMKDAKIVPLKINSRVVHQDEPVNAVYFPLTCMFSLLVTSQGRPSMELATIGNEGLIGAVEVLQKRGSMGLGLIQIPGNAVRVGANAFRKAVDARPQFRELIYHQLYALMRQILFGAGCNRIHSMEKRCARWLLMTHDRAGQDTFPLTQEFLSHMLGVRRATVNLALGALKKAGFIRYVRGKITMVDRRGLESASCGCYRAIVDVYSIVLSKPLRAS